MGSPKTNSDGVAAHETDYRPLEDEILRGLPRAMVVRMAAKTLADCFDLDVLTAIVEGGFHKFCAITKEQWHVHEFTTADYRAAFKLITLAHKDRATKAQGIVLH